MAKKMGWLIHFFRLKATAAMRRFRLSPSRPLRKLRPSLKSLLRCPITGSLAESLPVATLLVDGGVFVRPSGNVYPRFPYILSPTVASVGEAVFRADSRDSFDLREGGFESLLVADVSAEAFRAHYDSSPIGPRDRGLLAELPLLVALALADAAHFGLVQAVDLVFVASLLGQDFVEQIKLSA